MPDASHYYDHATELLNAFSAKHEEIDLVRDSVRQRINPREEIDSKGFVNIKQARGLALMFQMQSFFTRAASSIKVREEVNTKSEQSKTTDQERWLGGVSHMVASRAGFVYGEGMWHGLESGEMILQSAFNPYLARQGRFCFQPRAIDPRSCAYEWTDDGLGCFVRQESKPAGVVLKELFGRQQKSKGKLRIPSVISETAKQSPTTELLCRWYYDETREYYWVDDEFIWNIPHMMPNGVPFNVGYFYHIPSNDPLERGRGLIAPILDILDQEKQLWDVFATDVEFGSRNPVMYFDQNKNRWRVGLVAPGKEFDAPAQTPPKELPPSPSVALLQQLALMLGEQTDLYTLPKSSLSGVPQSAASGFALSLYNEPIKAKLDMLIPYAELCLGSHYETMLGAYKRLASNGHAKVIGRGDTEAYRNSFAVSVDLKAKPGGKKEKSWITLNPDDISDHPQVEVSLKPKLPSDKGAQMQQFDLAMRSGQVPREWAWEQILEVEDVGEMRRQWETDYLLKNNPTAQAFFSDKFMKDLLEDDRELKKEFEEWAEAQVEAQAAAPPPEQTQPEMQGAPLDPFAQLMAGQGQGAPPLPVGAGLPSAATLGVPQGVPAEAMGQTPPMNFLPPQGA